MLTLGQKEIAHVGVVLVDERIRLQKWRERNDTFARAYRHSARRIISSR